MTDSKKLVFAILKFLEDQKVSGQLDEEANESLEVAVQCLEQVYKINITEGEYVMKYSVPHSLLDIFMSQFSKANSNAASALSEPTEEQKEEAERLKNKGNEFMKTEQFTDALESYSQAIRLDSRNAVYFCNRAAAYSKLNQHQLSIEDCNRALVIDPTHSKAYGRMGIAFTATENYESARECYRKALELDPDNQSYKNNFEVAEQKIQENTTQARSNLGPVGGLSAAGGLENVVFGALFNDPNIVNMATGIMANPQVMQIMSNLMSENNPESGGHANFVQLTQQMASQMEQANPDLVQQIREQMRRHNQSDTESAHQDSNHAGE